MRALDFLTGRQRNNHGTGSETISGIEDWEQAVRSVDLAIILAGAPGEGRLDLAYSCISYIQHRYLPLSLPSPQPYNPSEHIPPPNTANPTQSVPRIKPPPSLSAFPTLSQRPFILPGFAKDWPATINWRSASYLRSCAGRGRVVPVERGGDYRDEGWEVDLMSWELFLDGIGWGKDHAETNLGGSRATDNDNMGVEGSSDSEGLYLAQHSLFTQFPKLRADILVPDYVYTSPGTHSNHPEAYSGPPGNDEQLVINAWCGGRGANSPAHTDPYYNIYVQVVGFKSVWLAPPETSAGMYAFAHQMPDSTNHEPSSGSPNNSERDSTNSELMNAEKKGPKREGMLGNTSSLDVFALSQSSSQNPNAYPLFYEHALPLAQSTILSPGDALIIPPGWWHAMRGVGGGSFSVSFWF
ncbi:Clavaminate synthase-like protein [Ceratobasidium sp. AG-I]|nr:Clavaminate synthase-like protein [Ceratobasidium sp. AG-I]